jgi:NADH-quinone oxidoreductase subunit C
MATPTPQTLPFHFTPVDAPTGQDAANPHAKAATFVPDVVQALQETFGDAVLDVTLYANEHTVRVEKSRLVDIARYLKAEQGFTYFVDMGGIDRFTDEDRFEVFYSLVNIARGQRLRLKLRVDEDDPTVPSLTGVYRAANWNEREAYDMFGLHFEGHPDLRRMFLPEDFEYFPLRKEFPLLGIPGSLPLPAQTPEGGLTWDPFAAAHGAKPVKSYEEQPSDMARP